MCQGRSAHAQCQWAVFVAHAPPPGAGDPPPASPHRGAASEPRSVALTLAASSETRHNNDVYTPIVYNLQ